MSDMEESVRRSIVALLMDERARLLATAEAEEAKGIPDETYYQYLSGMVHGVVRAALQISESQSVHCEATMSDPEGDILNTYIEIGGRWERAAIVAWLNEGGVLGELFAYAIERGEHLRGDDE